VLDRLVALYTAWDAAEPGCGHAAKARPWVDRRKQLSAASDR
jgi:hypothetical protein